MTKQSGECGGTAAEPDPFSAAEQLRLAYQSNGRPGLLEPALEAMLSAKDRYGADDPRHAGCLSGLCMLYRQKWERDCDRTALGMSVTFGWASVDVSPPGDSMMPRHMSSLATTLQELFDDTDDTKAIDEAIALYRGCLELIPPDDPEHAGQESNLANALLRRVQRHPDPALLGEAARHARAALRDTSPRDPMLPVRLVNLGGALMCLVQTGSLEHVAEAQEVYERGLRAFPPGHPARTRVQGTIQAIRDLRRSLGI